MPLTSNKRQFQTGCLLAAFCMMTITTPALQAQDSLIEPDTSDSATNPQIQVESKPTKVMLFKNGFGVVVSQADLLQAEKITPDHYGKPITFQTSLFPNAKLGSFWMSWTNNLALSNIKSTYAANKTQSVATDINEVIRANIGNMVAIELRSNDDKTKWIEATILDVPVVKNENPNEPRPLIQPPPQYANIVYLHNDNGVSAIYMHQIQSVRIKQSDTLPMIEKVENKPVLQFDTILPGRIAGVSPTVQTTYLAKGIAWSPSYVVDITGMTEENQQGSITAKAVVVNDLIDLEKVETELISGYPHIQFQDSESAMTLQPLNQYLQSIMSNREMRKRIPRSAMMNQARGYAGMAMDMEMAAAPQSPVKGETIEDLYFYQLDKIDLKKGERGYYPLFTNDIPANSIYTWNIPDFIDAYDNYRQPSPEEPQIVWHSLELTNKTDQPWTTAPAMTIKDGRILGQDSIKYTPVNSKTRLKITQALSVKAEIQEQEISRQRGAQKIDQMVYDVVTMEGTLALTNMKNDAVNLEITKLVSGELVSADEQPEAIRTPLGLGRANSQTTLKWKIHLEPGMKNALQIKYKYKFLTNGQRTKASMLRNQIQSIY
ncbi:hypothetical protein KS4_11450 [Poriferisphaera corsica]|uniref:DUF4139 domain-containing protein n=1 Tax=Poriferisphaera corsica TaxID=2528020 RepID=A0A517YSA5_9BACT|nr:DUF4139 domain-containing protein [Poriferisphaera corsica]QDU33103.1 hypothetical protein KS4_11450 [Poriferisphaera corsica]